jgi:hypothetical protein
LGYTGYKKQIWTISHSINELQNTMDNRHTYGTLQDTMDILRITNRGQYMNSSGIYIYKSRNINGNDLNDIDVKNENPIYEIIYKYEK